jgi:hypothetical protein
VHSLVEASDKPEPKVAKVDVSAAKADHHGGVTIYRATVDPAKREPVIITSARGVIVGDRNHQENTYQFDVKSPTVSVERLYKENPGARESLASLADNPNSSSAYRDLCRELGKGEHLYSGGRIDAGLLKGEKIQRIPLGSDSAGGLIIENAKGVLVGDGARQENAYIYRIEKAELSLTDALIRDRQVAVGLAVALRNPDDQEAQRAFSRDLARAFGESQGEIKELAGLHGNLDKLPLAVDAVQIGLRNTRHDRVAIEVDGGFVIADWDDLTDCDDAALGRSSAGVEQDVLAPGYGEPGREAAAPIASYSLTMTLTGWESPRDQQRKLREEDDSLRREQEFGRQRAAASRRPGVGARSADVADEAGGYSFGGLARATSAVTLSHVAPDRGYLTNRMAENLMSALGDVQPLAALPATGSTSPGGGSGQEDDPPDMLLVPLPALDAGSQESKPAHTDPQAKPLVPAAPAPALGAVVIGSGALPVGGRATAGDDPAGDPLARAQALLDDLRRRIWTERGGNAPEAVARALRARKALRVAIFFDPASGDGLWVDVGPDRRTAVAVLLIKLNWSTGLPGRFTAYDPSR